jgi:RimJ/RimL family protein N-acetyltransferase
MPPQPLLGGPLTDGDLTVREFTEDDADVMVAAFNDAEVTRWIAAPSPYGREQALEFIRNARESIRSGGDSLSLAVVVDERVVGSVSLRFTWEHLRADLGVAVFSGRRWHGFGTRATMLVARHAFDELGIRRIAILADARNKPVLDGSLKAGFTHEGTLRQYMQRDGRQNDMVSFSLLPDDLAR